MSDVSLCTGEEKAGVFLPNTFIDNYMRQANGEYVKIYLYLLRSLQSTEEEFSICHMADDLEHTGKDITRALRYWERENLLRLEYNASGELTGICLLDPDQPRLKIQDDPEENISIVRNETMTFQIPMEEMATAPVKVSVPPPVSTKKYGPIPSKILPMQSRRGIAKGPDHTYTPGEITLLGKDDEVKEILFVTESYMGHPLSPTESTTVLYWYDGMGMSSDLIEYLVEYCIECGHKDMNYMNKVAINWSEKGIDTKEKAMSSVKDYSSIYNSVIHAFGIKGRNLSVLEAAYVDRWQREYGFSEEMIKEACNRTILKAHDPSFNYADTILRSWHEAGVNSFSDVEAVDEAFSKRNKSVKQRSRSNTKQDKFHNFKGHEYDYDSIENRLLKQE